MDWLDLLAVQGTLKSLLQHHSSKASLNKHSDNIQPWHTPFPIWNQSVVPSNTLATWCKELTYWERPWFWERLKAGGEGDNRWWDGWMASPTWWTWVWVNSGIWWWTGRPGVLQSMGWQRVRHDWATELTDNWSEMKVSQLSPTLCDPMDCSMPDFPVYH